VSTTRWAIGRCQKLPEWLARHELPEIFARQETEKKAAGRYTLCEAAEEIARNTGERFKPVLKTIGPTPHRQHELDDQLLGGVTPITARLRQAAGAQSPIEIQVVEHALHESHAAPGGDLPVRELQLESHRDPARKPCTDWYAKIYP